MFLKFLDSVRKLLRLLAAGEFSKLSNALKLRIGKLLGGEYNPRQEIEAHQREVERVLLENFCCDNHTHANSLNIAVIVRGGSVMPQSSAFIRIIAPLTHPNLKQRTAIQVYPENTVSINPETDVCMVQRTAFDSRFYARKLTKNIRKLNIPLVVDTDDAFTVLEPGHNQYKEQRKRVKALDHVIEQADELWLSTHKLADLCEHPVKVVMENILDERLWRTDSNKTEMLIKADAPLRMLYTGTATHGSDLEMIMTFLDNLDEKKLGSFELTIIGVTDDLIDRPWIKRVRQPKFGAMYPNFVPWLLRQGQFDIGLSPLVDSEFNRSKSDIKCLDYLAAGMVPVVSDILPYQTPELRDFIIKATNNEDAWTDTLTEMIDDTAAFRKRKNQIITDAQDYIWSHRSSRQIAPIMLERIEKLTRKNF